MHIVCKPEKIDETIKAVRDMAVGGNLKVEKIRLTREKWNEMFAPKSVDRRTGKPFVAARGEHFSGVPVEFSTIANKDAIVILGPSDVEEPKPAPKAKAAKPAPKAKK